MPIVTILCAKITNKLLIDYKIIIIIVIEPNLKLCYSSIIVIIYNYYSNQLGKGRLQNGGG